MQISIDLHGLVCRIDMHRRPTCTPGIPGDVCCASTPLCWLAIPNEQKNVTLLNDPAPCGQVGIVCMGGKGLRMMTACSYPKNLYCCQKMCSLQVISLFMSILLQQ